MRVDCARVHSLLGQPGGRATGRLQGARRALAARGIKAGACRRGAGPAVLRRAPDPPFPTAHPTPGTLAAPLPQTHHVPVLVSVPGAAEVPPQVLASDEHFWHEW